MKGGGGRTDALVAGWACVVALLAGGRTTNWGWAVIDDGVLVARRPTVTAPFEQPLLDLLLTPGMGHAMPVTNATLALDHALWGLAPGGWHASNVLWFALALAVSAVVARRWLHGVSRWALMAAVALVGWHPVLAEPVAWISSRKDLVAAAMVALALLPVVPRADRAPPSRAALAASFAAASLALGAKSTVVAVGPALLLLWWRVGASRRALSVASAAWGVLGAGAIALAAWHQESTLRRGLDGAERLWAAVASLEHHLGRLAGVPGASYEMVATLTPSVWGVGLALATLATGVWAGTVFGRRGGRDAAIPWAVLAGGMALGPVIFGASDLVTALADRYVLPVLLPPGLLLVAAGLERLPVRAVAPASALALALAALVARPAQAERMEAWRSPVSFYEAVATTHDLRASTTLPEAWSCYWRGSVFVASPDHDRVPFFESERDREIRLLLAYRFWDACTSADDAVATCRDSDDPLACELRRITRRDRDRALRMWRSGATSPPAAAQ